MKCPKCEGEMEEGMIPTYKIGATPASFWVEKYLLLKEWKIKEIL